MTSLTDSTNGCSDHTDVLHVALTTFVCLTGNKSVRDFLIAAAIKNLVCLHCTLEPRPQ